MNNSITKNPLNTDPKAATLVPQSSLDTTNQGEVKTSAKSSDSTSSQGNGLKGEYYDNQNFTNLKVSRIDPTVNFHWGYGSPDKSIGAESFSVRWTGEVEAKYSEDYTFYTKSDDGVRLWVNGQQLIDRFVNQGATEYNGKITLEAGKKYDIKLEYFEYNGVAVSQLSWSSASQSKEIIPQSQLYTDVTAPSATANAPELTTSGGNTYTFNVTYNDDTAIKVTTLDSNDILVTGPNGFSQLAKFVSVDENTNSSSRTATYSISPVEGWNASKNGSYTIALQANQVSDTNGNFTTAGTIGNFQVNIAGTGTGLKGQYYDNQNFTDLKVTRIDPTVNFNWGLGSPDKSIGADSFSVRWTGQVEAKHSEDYTFYTKSDDGVRLWVNGQQIINNFVNQSAKELSGAIALEAGKKYDVKLEYFEGKVDALSQLSWSSASQSKEIIPQSQLYTDVTGPSVITNAPNLTTSGSNTYTFNVTYTDDTIVNVATLDSNDLLVSGPNGFSQLAKFVSVDDNSENSPRTATYSINTVEGNWSASNNGTYAIALQANQVSDIDGNFTTAGTIGNFQVNITGTGTGLKGEYYDNQNFTNLKVTRTDPRVNFDWGYGSPDKSIGAESFSVRWTGKVEAKYSEDYTFYTKSDDGVRLWVNGQQIIDRFVNQGTTEYSGKITLEAGKKYDIKLEYFEYNGVAVSQLSWSSASQSKEIIPQSQLYLPVITPTITLGSSVTTVRESNANANITVVRSGDDLTKTSSVKYATTAETATAGVDYTETAGTITFEPGETSKQITIPILNDSLAEQDETFGLVIDQTEGADLGIQRTLSITIQDDDRLDLVFSKPIVNEKDGIAIVTATRGKSSEVASVNYTTVDGSAIAGSDYQGVSGTLNFAAGQNSKTITIPIINDTVGEPNESFTLKFSNAVGVGLNIEDTSVISIIDDDPGKFIKETVVSGLDQPTAFDWTPDGKQMFIAQKDGIVKVFDNGKLLTKPFIDISQQVNNVRDRGLLGIAVHPDFPNTPYVYLLFTYDPPEVYTNTTSRTLDNPDQPGNRAARLIRVTADVNTNYTTAVAGSEVVLLGKNSTWNYISHPDGNSTNVNSDNKLNFAPSGIVDQDGQLFANTQDYLNNLKNITNVEDFIATDSESHSIGTVRFGTDGSLFVGVGDGTSYNREDPRALRVQDVDNLSGKILRIDPITGEGLADNPFYNNDPDSNRSKVYNLGFRNPFRFTIDKRNNTPVIGDVGWRTWEEVNIGKKGANFGWPYFEGGLDSSANVTSLKQSDYASNSATSASATAFYNSGSTVTAPTYTYKHSGSNAIVVGDFYTGTTFPSIYQNALFIGDASQGTIDALTFDDQGKVTSVKRFADSTTDPNSPIVSPVQITTGPDSNLYYVSLYTGKIERWKPV